MLYGESIYYLHFLHLLNVSCTRLLFQHAALGLHFPVTDLDNFVAESGCDLFESLVSRLTVDSVSNDCHFVAPTCMFNDVVEIGRRVRVGVRRNSREIEICDDEEECCACDENIVVVLRGS